MGSAGDRRRPCPQQGRAQRQERVTSVAVQRCGAHPRSACPKRSSAYCRPPTLWHWGTRPICAIEWDITDRDENTEAARDGLAPLDLHAEVLTISGLAALEPVSALIEGFLAKGQLAELIGKPGVGKTFVALSMALSIATGTPWCGHRVPQARPVIYIAAEGAEGVWVRVLAWCEAHSVDPATLEGRFFVSPVAVQMGNADHMAQLRTLVDETRAGLVVFDTRARTTVGLEENSATDQGMAIRAADVLRENTGSAVLVIHHVTEGTERGRGSTAWLGAVWSSLLVSARDATNISIKCARHKEWACGDSYNFTLASRTVSATLMGGIVETRRTTCVLTDAAGPAAAETEQQRADNNAVWAVIDAHPGRPVSGLKQTDMAQALDISGERFDAAVARLERARRAVNAGARNRGEWCTVTLTDAMADTTVLNRDNADGLTIVGSPKHAAEVARCVAVITEAVENDADMGSLPETKMYLALGARELTLRAVFVVAYERWKSAAAADGGLL